MRRSPRRACLAAHLLQASADELAFADGRFTVRGSDRGIALLALAKSARDPANLPDGMTPGLGEHVMNMTDVFTFPSGCHVAEVEIDPETGATTLVRYTAVDDYGRLINPLLTEGQVQGGVAQGIGQAMLEHTVYDPQSGQLLSGSFMDYALPRADDLPSFDIDADRAADRWPIRSASRARARRAASPRRRPSWPPSSMLRPAAGSHAGVDAPRHAGDARARGVWRGA